MDGLRIRLFGEIAIEREGRSIVAPPAKPLELLCYLLLTGQRAHTREELSTVLWPDAPPGSSKRYLRQALWKLNTALRHAGEGSRALLKVDAEFVRIETEASCWVDVGAFERTHASLHAIPGDRLDDEQAASLDLALELYRGELMPAWYQDWCIYERERLQLNRITMLEQLMAYCQSLGRLPGAIGYGQTILRHDHARERTHRELMRLYYLLGDRTAAMRQYERCARALAAEFDLPPDSQTVALHEQIRADQLDESTLRVAVQRPHVDLLVDVRQQLDSIQRSLRTLHELVSDAQVPEPHAAPLSAGQGAVL